MCILIVLAFSTIDNNIVAQYDQVSITGATEVPVVFHGETQRLDEYIEDTTIVHPITRPPRDGYLPKHDWPLHPVTNPNALPIGNDPVWQSNHPQINGLQNSSQMPLGVNFDGMNSGATVVGDPTMDAGPNHVIQMINGASGATFKVWDKQGVALTANVQFDTFFGFASGYGDPIVLYDHEADRWLLSEFEVKFAQNSLFIAISTSPNPMGTWYTYTIQNDQFPDYPKYAVWPDMYVVTTNETNQCGFFALDRASMLAGTAHNAQRFTTGEFGGDDFFLAGSPVHWDGATPPPADSPAIAMRMKDDGWAGVASDGLEFWELNIDFTNSNNSTLSIVQDLAVAPFSSNLCSFTDWSCIQQPNGAIPLDPLLEVLMNRVQYRNFGTHESIVCCHAVDVDGNDRAGIRWYELRRNGGDWSVYQQGTYSPDFKGRWMGTIAMDEQGNIALGYNISSLNMFPSIKYTGRFADSPLGQMTWPETTIVLGTGVHNSNRYGDYNQMVWDPSSNSFWMTAMYNDAVWKTRIASFNVPPGGCTDATACNYDAAADLDDGSCCFSTCLTITMTDSYGDGWNFAEWSIINDQDVVLHSGTLDVGYFGMANVCLEDGCYYFSVTGGLYPSEIGWEIEGMGVGPISGEVTYGESISFSVGVIQGCMDTMACNYNPDAVCPGDCTYSENPIVVLPSVDWMLEYNYNCLGSPGEAVLTFSEDYTFTYSNSGGTWSLCNEQLILLFEFGTLYAGSYNGELFAGTISGDINSCFYMYPLTLGCIDSNACNYDVDAVIDDGSCIAPGCDDPLACNYDEASDPLSVDYNPASCYAEYVCLYAFGWNVGCTYILALNYNPVATVDDGSCVYQECINNCGDGTFYDEATGMCLPSVSACTADITGDGNVNVEDLLLMLAQFGDVCI